MMRIKIFQRRIDKIIRIDCIETITPTAPSAFVKSVTDLLISPIIAANFINMKIKCLN